MWEKIHTFYFLFFEGFPKINHAVNNFILREISNPIGIIFYLLVIYENITHFEAVLLQYDNVYLKEAGEFIVAGN